MIVVIHHSADFDGLFCREVARKEFGDTAEYIGWDYGDAPPVVSDEDDVYLLDISIEPLMNHPRLVWIDHHKTAIDKFGRRPGLQIDGVAACRLAWQYWFGARGEGKADYINRQLTEPLAVRLAGEFDVWDKRDERADVFQYGLKSCYMENRWQTLVSLDGECPAIKPTAEVEAILRFGEIAKGYADNTNAEIMKACGFDVEWEGLRFLALNTARCNSLTFQSAVRPDHDALLGFRYNGRGWTVSLYGVPHRPDLDLSPIAQKYGGGGHRQACGFQVSPLPFIVEDT